MESVPHREEGFPCYKFIFLEARYIGQAETTTVHFKFQPDYIGSSFLFDGRYGGCDNVNTLDVI